MSLLDAELAGGRQWTRIGDCYNVTKKPRTTDRFSYPTIPFVPMEAIPQGGAYAATVSMRAPDQISSGTYFERGDVLIAKITPSFENGKQALALDLPAPFGYASTEIIPLHPKDAGHDRRLLFFYLLHPDVRAYVAERMEGSTGRQRVPENVLLDLAIPDFSLEEQTAIASALEAIQQTLTAEHKCEQATRALKRATMSALFTRGLRGEARRESEIGSIPESWSVSTLSGVAKLERGRFLHRPRNEPRFYGGQTPFVQTGDVVRSGGRIRAFSQSLNESGVEISRVFSAGTILITIAANIGYSGILEFDSACPDSLVGITTGHFMSSQFLQFWLQTQQETMDQRAPKGTQKNINIQFLSPWPVPVPSTEEQREIAVILDALDCKIELHGRKRAVLEDLFESLLHKLMTGEIRVADLDLTALTAATATEAAA